MARRASGRQGGCLAQHTEPVDEAACGGAGGGDGRRRRGSGDGAGPSARVTGIVGSSTCGCASSPPGEGPPAPTSSRPSPRRTRASAPPRAPRTRHRTARAAQRRPGADVGLAPLGVEVDRALRVVERLLVVLRLGVRVLLRLCQRQVHERAVREQLHERRSVLGRRVEPRRVVRHRQRPVPGLAGVVALLVELARRRHRRELGERVHRLQRWER